jgi:Ca2+-binding RTX toxin-like protein
VDGGSGGDELDGEAGNDTVLGGFGGDVVGGGEGDDVIDGGAAGDRVDGGPGNDEVHGGSATDEVRGGDGDDRVFSDSGYDALDAGGGNDTVFVNNGTAVGTVDCGPGADTLFINPYERRGGISNAQAIREGRVRGCEQIVESPRIIDPAVGVRRLVRERGGRAEGTERNDTLLGATGPDVLVGLGGHDVLWGNRLPDGPSRGVDRISAGDGDDTVYGSRNGRTVMDGGPGNDYLQGGILTSDNTITGGPGIDTIRLTGDGPNVVGAGTGDDLVYAYAKGRTRVNCGPGDDAVKIGYNRGVRTRNCENVRRRYKGQD